MRCGIWERGTPRGRSSSPCESRPSRLTSSGPARHPWPSRRAPPPRLTARARRAPAVRVERPTAAGASGEKPHESGFMEAGLPGAALGSPASHSRTLGLRRTRPLRSARRERGCRPAASEGLSPAVPAALPDPAHAARRHVRPKACPAGRRRHHRLVQMPPVGPVAVHGRDCQRPLVEPRVRLRDRHQSAREPIRRLRHDARPGEPALRRSLAARAREWSRPRSCARSARSAGAGAATGRATRRTTCTSRRPGASPGCVYGRRPTTSRSGACPLSSASCASAYPAASRRPISSSTVASEPPERTVNRSSTAAATGSSSVANRAPTTNVPPGRVTAKIAHDGAFEHGFRNEERRQPDEVESVGVVERFDRGREQRDP